jgi:phosphate transport system substrate-binding protein
MKAIRILICVMLFAACGRNNNSSSNSNNAPAKKAIQIKGSDTVLPLSQKEAELYMKKNAGSAVTVTGGGSGVGITALMEGTTDIAMSSRSLKAEERLELKNKNIGIVETIIANDALAVIVNPENKVDQLTHEQLMQIFTGAITNWNKVGGPDLKIVALSRETSSGTYEFFKEHVMDKKNYAPSVLSMPATGAIIESVAKTKGAIGYVGLAYISPNVKAIKVSFDEGKTFVSPSIQSAQNNTYPVSRPLYYFYNVNKQETVKPFVDYILSEEGQKIVLDVGYVPISK